ncbi:MAG TPA: hypothetical protein PLN69_08955 [bacterium]|nr:hypothetical protein [bacterium]
MKRITVTTIFLLLMAITTHAAVPKLINYQGYLKEAGVAVTGTKDITIALYDAETGGILLCSSGSQSLSVTRGLFNYKIGSGGCDLSTIDWDKAVYLELSVEEITMSPREQITGSAYSVETRAVNVEFDPTGTIVATDVQSAIEELDSEKLSVSGGSLTGNITTTGNVTAAEFHGDGSNLTGLASGGDINGVTAGTGLTGGGESGTVTLNVADNYVLNTGDTMSGALGISQGAATDSLSVYQTGSTNKAGHFEIDNASNVNHAIAGSTNGTGAAGVFDITNTTSTNNVVYAAHSGLGDLYEGNHTGSSGNLIKLQSGGDDKLTVDKSGNIYASGTVTATSFSGDGSELTGIVASGGVSKTGDTMSGALEISQGAATDSLSVYQTGTTDKAGHFEIDNASNANHAIAGSTNGTGAAGVFDITNTTSTNNVVYAAHSGLGDLYEGNHTGASGNLIHLQSDGTDRIRINKSGRVIIDTDASSSHGLFLEHYGDMEGIVSKHFGTTIYSAGYFGIHNSSSSGSALKTYSEGTGSLFWGSHTGTGNILFGNHTGTSGNLIQLQSDGTDKFVVDKTGSVTASSFSGDGSGLSGVGNNWETGVFTKNYDDGVGTTVINTSFEPRYIQIRVIAISHTGGEWSESFGSASSASNENAIYYHPAGATSGNFGVDSSNIVVVPAQSGTSNMIVGEISSITSSNFTINWTTWDDTLLNNLTYVYILWTIQG